jgi:aminoglycoside phosphotransferase
VTLTSDGARLPRGSRAVQGWSLRPVARLGRPRDVRSSWLAEGDPGEVIVKLSANPFAPERARWAVEALALLRAPGVPVPEVLWSGRLDEQWFVVVQVRLPGEPVRTVDASLLDLSNVLTRDGVITGIVDWDHIGLGSRALDLTSLLFDWQRGRAWLTLEHA